MIDSNVDTHAIDHNSDMGDINHAEREDTNANPAGVWRQENVDTDIPPWIFDDFNLTSRVNQETGEFQQFLNPKPAVVKAVADDAPNRLASGIEEMTQEDYTLAEQLAADMRNYMETAGAVDEFFANSPLYHLKSELTNAAVRATRWVKTIRGGLSRVKEGAETPEWITGMITMVRDTNRRCAIISMMLSDLDPDYRSKLSFIGAAWTVMQQEARKNQDKYLAGKQTNKTRNENEVNTSMALAAGL